MGRRPRDLMDLASINPERLTFTPTKQDLVNEEIQRSAMRTHLEVQQLRKHSPRSCRKNEVCSCQSSSGRKRVLLARRSEQIQQGRKSGKWLKVEITAVKGPKIVISAGASIFQVNASKLRRPLDPVDLEELPDSRERTGSLVLWLPCEGQTDVWELFSDNTFLSAILDPPSAPQRTKLKASLIPAVAGLLVKAQGKESQDCWDVSGCFVSSKWQQYRLCLAVAEHQIFGGMHFLIVGPE